MGNVEFGKGKFQVDSAHWISIKLTEIKIGNFRHYVPILHEFRSATEHQFFISCEFLHTIDNTLDLYSFNNCFEKAQFYGEYLSGNLLDEEKTINGQG